MTHLPSFVFVAVVGFLSFVFLLALHRLPAYRALRPGRVVPCRPAIAADQRSRPSPHLASQIGPSRRIKAAQADAKGACRNPGPQISHAAAQRTFCTPWKTRGRSPAAQRSQPWNREIQWSSPGAACGQWSPTLARNSSSRLTCLPGHMSVDHEQRPRLVECLGCADPASVTRLRASVASLHNKAKAALTNAHHRDMLEHDCH